jgi:hypothetical protein
MPVLGRKLLWTSSAALLIAAPGARGQELAVLPPESPESYLGFRPGEDRRLADWDQITGYLDHLGSRSERVRVDTLGHSTLDRPLVQLTLTSPENLARLAELREIQARLADPRRIAAEEQRAELIRSGRLVVLVTSAIHGTEVGAALVPIRLAYRLATSEDPAVKRILSEAIVILVPSLNPDGVQAVTDWYRSTIDMPWEGAPPPFLYHHYVGHDNNRDWYAFTQTETRVLVERVHNVWHPQIVHDIHQQRSDGSRFFVPPWIDPIEPNVDPLLISATNALGAAIAWELHRSGRTGVVMNATYDAWSPSRAYQHYHAGVRLLSETAGARMASPVELQPQDLKGSWGFDPVSSSWNFPEPWPGGRWGLDDVLDYMEAGALALLSSAASDRERWLEGFVSVGERAVAGWESWPDAWVIPRRQRNAAGVAELLRILRTGGVEIGRATGPLSVPGREFGEGSLVIDMHQPYASFAQALLERQPYPEAYEYEGGPPREPYDVTAHALPLLLDVEAVSVRGPVRGDTAGIEEPGRGPPRRVEGLSDAPGALIGLYQPYMPSIDEGWTRWVFDRYSIPYVTLHNEDVRQGDLAREFTAIVIPSSPFEVLRDGWAEGSLPQRYTGGLGPDAVAALREFVEAGGTLVGLNRASSFLIESLRLPVRDRLADLDRRDFFAPGAIVSLKVDTAHPLGANMPRQTAAWFEEGLAFELVDPAQATAVASYGASPTLLSGWIVGEGRLAERPAMVEISQGRGRVILLGFRPQYRGHSLATFPLLFNALRPSPPG